MADDNLWLAVANKKEAVEYGEAIQRVRELHKETNGYCVYCVDIGSCCNPKDFEYPCPTIQALYGEQ